MKNKLETVTKLTVILNNIVFVGLAYKKAVLNLPMSNAENILLYSSLVVMLVTFLVEKKAN